VVHWIGGRRTDMSDQGAPDAERWRQIEDTCWKALTRPVHEHGSILDDACAGDPDLRHEVESLLAVQSAIPTFLETPAGDIAADLLATANDLTGRRLGPYVIGEWVGSGGMGDVYRARDEHLARTVALKILPGVFADSGDRSARLMAEAQVVASLNHPNIAAIYGLEKADDLRALVLEFVDGVTLADRLAEGPVPIDEALPIARQIAEGLEAAHECGIVHRDIKPSNIIVRNDGTVKLLDFGLATAFRDVATPGGAPAAMMGTPGYASPEQLRGRGTDRRTDIWAFGVVLFELLSGHRAFAGDATSDIVTAVLQQRIDWSVLPATTPVTVRGLLSRCLERDVRQRLRDIGEARITLEQISKAVDGDARPLAATADATGRRSLVPLLLAAVGGMAIAAAAAWSLRPAPAAAPAVARFTHSLPAGQSIRLPATRHVVAVSRDGQQVVYVTEAGLQLRSVSSLDVRTVRGTEALGAVTSPVFSPAGDAIAFWTPLDRTIKRIPIAGGEAVSIVAADDPYGMSWDGDHLLFGQGANGIMRVRADGGVAERLATVEDGEEAHGPQMLPGGDRLLFTIATGMGADRWDTAKIVVDSLASRQRTVVIDGGTDARYVPSGHLVYGRSDTGFGASTIFAATFDVGQTAVTGPALPVINGVRTSSSRLSGALQFAVSPAGTLAYIPGSRVGAEYGKQQLVLADRSGRTVPLSVTPGDYHATRVSPDGARIAVEVGTANDMNIYVTEIATSAPLRRVTFGGRNSAPVWSPDGSHIAFQSDRDTDRAIFSQSADGSGAAVRLTRPGAGESHTPESWSADGRTLLFSVTTSSMVSLATLSTENRRVTAFSDVTSVIPMNARFSPDGRWVAYARADRGTPSTIFVEPFPATGAKYQLVVQGPLSVAHKPVWSPDGRELLYVPRLGGFEAVSVTTRRAFAFGRAVPLPRKFSPGAPTVRALYDITPDGRFVGVVPVGDTGAIYSEAHVEVVLNWLEELKRLVPPK
jgi:eukaryotic-like serine/threonine-protein kinase